METQTVSTFWMGNYAYPIGKGHCIKLRVRNRRCLLGSNRAFIGCAAACVHQLCGLRTIFSGNRPSRLSPRQPSSPRSTPHLGVGTLVLGQRYRNPGPDGEDGCNSLLSGGRFILGLGGGWKEDEHKAYGFDSQGGRPQRASSKRGGRPRRGDAHAEPRRALQATTTPFARLLRASGRTEKECHHNQQHLGSQDVICRSHSRRDVERLVSHDRGARRQENSG